MKSPAILAVRWRRQWEIADQRESRLLNHDVWPQSLPIGKPTPREFAVQTADVREHVRRWREVTTGEVTWESVKFRAGSEPIELPTAWVLHGAADWAAATGDPSIQLEYDRIRLLLSKTEEKFHRTIIRQRRLIADRSDKDILTTVSLVEMLTPGCASGRPLRTLSVAGIDSKFFERHRALILQLLDVRYEGQASELGLESFLGALDEGDQWLLIAPLERGLFPFEQQSVRSRELRAVGVPGTHVLIVENERCLYHLPPSESTVAILGSGLNLAWMQGEWLQDRKIAYWGDMDSWGLAMLATARTHQPGLEALLMTREVFDVHAPRSAVVEPLGAGDLEPAGLTASERSFYQHLKALERGRLEQEFLPIEQVHQAVYAWRRAEVCVMT